MPWNPTRLRPATALHSAVPELGSMTSAVSLCGVSQLLSFDRTVSYQAGRLPKLT